MRVVFFALSFVRHHYCRFFSSLIYLVPPPPHPPAFPLDVGAVPSSPLLTAGRTNGAAAATGPSSTSSEESPTDGMLLRQRAGKLLALLNDFTNMHARLRGRLVHDSEHLLLLCYKEIIPSSCH
jgi:hypothetical protein